MRKTSTLLLLILPCIFTKAQGWLDVGFKGGWGVSMLFNTNIWDDQTYNHVISTAPTFGGKIGYNFNMEHELTFDIMAGNMNQEFSYTDELTGTNVKYTSTYTYKSMDFLMMYRHNQDGKYFEIGPAISSIKSVNRSDSNPFLTDIQLKGSNFNHSIKAMAVGFGSYLLGTENFGFTMGARLSYSFNDLISEDGQNYDLPTFRKYENYRGTHPFFIQLMFEANFDFAYLAKAKCGRKKILMF